MRGLAEVVVKSGYTSPKFIFSCELGKNTVIGRMITSLYFGNVKNSTQLSYLTTRRRRQAQQLTALISISTVSNFSGLLTISPMRNNEIN